MRFTTILLLVLSFLMMTGIITAEEQSKGAEQINLYGGTNGDVPFPHLRHQTALGDCKICHDLFPREAGVIEKMKAENKLERRQVMDTHCRKCHREKKAEGVKSGPTSCKKCHTQK